MIKNIIIVIATKKRRRRKRKRKKYLYIIEVPVKRSEIKNLHLVMQLLSGLHSYH